MIDMEIIHEKEEKNTAAVKTIAAVCLIIFVTVGAQAGLAFAYQGHIYPGVHVNGLRLGGMTQEEAVRAIQERVVNQIEHGLDISVNGEIAHIDLDVISENDPDLTRPIVDSGVDMAATHAYNQGRSESVILTMLMPLLPIIDRPNIKIPTTIETGDLSNRILEAFPEYNKEPNPTKFMITKENDIWNIAVAEGSNIETLGMESTLSTLTLGFSHLDEELLNSPVEIPVVVIRPKVTLEEAIELIPKAQSIIDSSPYTITYTDHRKRTHNWYVTDTNLSEMLIPTEHGVYLDDEILMTFLEPIETSINIEAQDARFEANGSRVSMFVPSRDGQEVNVEETLSDIKSMVLNEKDESVVVSVDITSPQVELADANDLGIEELLGTGVSSFAGSPYNRIQNIRNGVNLLNGILVPPGEVLSLIESLAPFTTTNGYLPELVIKGDKIEPEIGGGLCQIGTTTFRATMMSGLEVTQRRNHSLVVNYYNDLRNGNPGTDATIYSPYPDYKLTNDTENYILFEAVMDEPNRMLYFSFWGTDDGRVGSYTEPVVERWIGVGEQRDIETTDLPPGTVKCQGAHPGAVTSFTYTVTRADGSIDEQEFASQYRSLPKICLVGVEEIAQEELVIDMEEKTSDSETPTAD